MATKKGSEGTYQGPAQVDVELPDPGPSFEEKQGPRQTLTQTDWQELVSIELAKPASAGAQVQISGNVTDSADKGVTYNFATIEVRVVLIVGAHREVVFSGELGGAVAGHLYSTDLPLRASRIIAEARVLVDGAAGGSVRPTEAVAWAWATAFYRK